MLQKIPLNVQNALTELAFWLYQSVYAHDFATCDECDFDNIRFILQASDDIVWLRSRTYLRFFQQCLCEMAEARVSGFFDVDAAPVWEQRALIALEIRREAEDALACATQLVDGVLEQTLCGPN